MAYENSENKHDTQQQTVKTNIGEMPIEDYREIFAYQYGFDSYKEMYNQGYRIADDSTEKQETKKSYDKTDLSFAICTNDIDKVKEIIKSDKQIMEDYCAGETPLHTAVRSEATECVDEFLKRGAFVDALDAKRNTPLYYAVQHNNCKLAEKLLKAGANPELKNGDGVNLCDCVCSRDMKQLVDSYSIERKNSTHRSMHL